MNNKIFLWLLCALTIVSAGCSKSAFLDINDDPNNPTDVPPKVLLPSATLTVAFANGNELARVASLLIQHNAGVQNQAIGQDLYQLDGSFDNSWTFEIYSGALPPINSLINKTGPTGLGPHYSGVGKILKAYLFAMATDLWGDVPYSQAGQGLEFPKPRFDKQEDIYQGNSGAGIQSIFDLVKDGIADLKKPTPAGGFELGADDLVFYTGAGQSAQDRVDKWIRVGNTLLLKLAITISNSNSGLAKSIIDGVIADNMYITSNSQDLDVKFGTDVGSESPFYSFNVVNRPTDLMLSSRFLNLIKSLKAEKYLGQLYTSPNSTFTGFENGSNVAAPPLNTRSVYNTFVTGPVNNITYVRMLSNSQRAFILSEAALVLNTAGDANALFQEGIRQAMLKSGLAQSDVDAYFTANPTLVTLTGTTEQKRKQIITWKYIANVTNPLEAYNDYRRTGYPELQPSLNASGDDPSVIPKRLPYSPGETSANPNTPKPRPLTNQKVWWGK